MSEKIPYTSRRDFLKMMGITVPVIGISGMSLQACKTDKSTPGGSLFTNFTDPPPEARPFYRWWWNGNRVERGELVRELQLMKESGTGGIEINPIAMPRQLVNPGGKGLTWLSPEWCDIVRFTAQEAASEGMVTDLIVGTGWPFGGEFLSEEDTIKGLTVEKHRVSGPGIRMVELNEVPENEKLYRIALVPEKAEKLDDLFVIDALPENGIVEVELDEGNYFLVVIRIKTGFREVFRGAPGGAGPVLDHFNAGSVRSYLDHMSEALSPHFDGNLGNGIRSMFCDSIELEGANWTSDLPEIFRQMHDYDLEPFLPLLMLEEALEDNFEEIIDRVRYDYSKTLAHIFRKDFIETFHDWCGQQQVQSRYQAYGHPWLYTDLVNGYMIPDIPEGDQWLFNSGWSNSRINEIRYAIWNKYASSGGHLANRKIISSEAMTNTKGVFQATLEYMKQAADLNFVAGINHLVLHGFNYSPPDAAFPGWVQYGSYFNEQNTWWPYLPLFMEYVSRISAVLQAAQPVSQVAIMGPTPDIWKEYGLDRNPFNVEPWYLHSLWQAFSSQGVSSDYINGEVLRKSVFRNGNIHIGKMQYHTLVVCDMEFAEEPVVRSMLQFVESGGKIIFLGKTPARSAGLTDHEKNDASIRDLTERMVNRGAHIRKAPSRPEKDLMSYMLDWTGKLITEMKLNPGISINGPDPLLFTTQFVHEQNPVWFIANVNADKDLETRISLPASQKRINIWDPISGERKHLPDAGNGEVTLYLDRLESALLVTDDQVRVKTTFDRRQNGKALHISGPWQVEFIPATGGTTMKKDLEMLGDISKIRGLEDFSGTMTYTRRFNLEDTDFTHLDAGAVFDIAELEINGRSLGVRWYGKKVFELDKVLQEGVNEIKIKVINTLFNYCLAQERDPEIAYWISADDRSNGPLPAGLVGPVRLLFSVDGYNEVEDQGKD